MFQDTQPPLSTTSTACSAPVLQLNADLIRVQYARRQALYSQNDRTGGVPIWCRITIFHLESFLDSPDSSVRSGVQQPDVEEA